MLRAFSSAVSGMRSEMAFLDVVANNIANVNTTAFKASRVRFADMLYQTLSGGSGPDGDTGSINPTQIGVGVRLGGVDTNMTQGALRATGNPLDLAIDGDGFFVLSGDGGTTKLYTRDGSFGLDSNGDLINPTTGMKVLDKDGNKITVDTKLYSSITVTPGGKIVGAKADGSGTADIGQLGLARFNNPAGLLRTGDNLYREAVSSGAAEVGEAGKDGRGSVRAGVVEGSNTDLAQEFTNMISAQRGFQASSRIVSTADELLQDLVNLKR